MRLGRSRSNFALHVTFTVLGDASKFSMPMKPIVWPSSLTHTEDRHCPGMSNLGTGVAAKVYGEFTNGDSAVVTL